MTTFEQDSGLQRVRRVPHFTPLRLTMAVPRLRDNSRVVNQNNLRSYAIDKPTCPTNKASRDVYFISASVKCNVRRVIQCYGES